VTVNYKGHLLWTGPSLTVLTSVETGDLSCEWRDQGWVEALPLMKEGAKWQLFIPPGLAYGETGAEMPSG